MTASQIMMNLLAYFMLEFLYQFFEIVYVFIFWNRFQTRDHDIILNLEKSREVGKHNTDSRTLLFHRIEIWIGVTQTVEGLCHTFDWCLLDTATSINHNALDYGWDTFILILELRCEGFIFHFQDSVIWKLCLDIVCTWRVHKNKFSSLSEVTLFSDSLNLPTKSKGSFCMVNSSLLTVHVHNLIVGWRFSNTNFSFHAKENVRELILWFFFWLIRIVLLVLISISSNSFIIRINFWILLWVQSLLG